jgi:hypothetical protein
MRGFQYRGGILCPPASAAFGALPQPALDRDYLIPHSAAASKTRCLCCLAGAAWRQRTNLWPLVTRPDAVHASNDESGGGIRQSLPVAVDSLVPHTTAMTCPPADAGSGGGIGLGVPGWMPGLSSMRQRSASCARSSPIPVLFATKRTTIRWNGRRLLRRRWRRKSRRS